MSSTTTITPRIGLAPEALRERRERAGLTRVDLAARAGVSLTHVANLEAGAVPKRSEALDRLLRVLAEAEVER